HPTCFAGHLLPQGEKDAAIDVTWWKARSPGFLKWGSLRMRFWPLAALVLALAPPALAASGPADARFKALYTREWAWRMNEFPERNRIDAPIPDRLPKMDPAS